MRSQNQSVLRAAKAICPLGVRGVDEYQCINNLRVAVPMHKRNIQIKLPPAVTIRTGTTVVVRIYSHAWRDIQNAYSERTITVCEMVSLSFLDFAI